MSEWVGMATNSPFTRPTRTAPVGLRNGIVRHVQSGAGPDHAQYVRIVLLVGGVDRGHDLDFVDVVGREERADRSIDQAAR